MHVDPSRFLAPALNLRPHAAAPWRVGDVVFARVIGPTTQNSSRAAGDTLMQIGNRVVSAQSRLPLAPGQILQLRVAQLGQQPLLQVEARPASRPALTRALANTLPRQLDPPQLARLMRSMVAVATPEAGKTGAKLLPVPAPVAAASRALLQTIPAATEVMAPRALATALAQVTNPVKAQVLVPPTTPAQAQQTTDTSRYFPALVRVGEAVRAQLPQAAVERGDAQTQTALRPANPASQNAYAIPARDARLPGARAPAAQAQQLPAINTNSTGGATVTTDLAGLRDLVDGALARIRGQHLLAVHQQPAGPLPLAADLPVVWRDQVDLWHFQFECPPAEASPGEDGVCVRLLLQMEETGTVEAAITLAGGRVRITLDSSSGALRESLRSNLATLEQQLERQGLTPGVLRVGPLPPASAAPLKAPLVQERA